RYLTLMDSDFPSELGQAFRSMENSSNPWGMSQGERADWTAGVDGIEIVEGGDPMTAEYLYWVGCAGSFDDKNKKVTQSMAKLMQRADVDFAILGPSEACTGDSARRSGNEYLFQMLATQNVETLNSMGVKKIVTQCPHCFNTLANEYPQLGGHYEVVHHSQFLEWLVDQGRLDLSEAELDERVVYHDSCYLGRHNDVYMAPRKVLGSLGGIQLVEAERSGTKGMCCGAGGARMWMEEDIGDKVNDVRAQELVDTGADRVAVACPFCYVMMDDGVKAAGKEEDEVLVADIAITVLEAIETGEGKREAAEFASQVELANLSHQPGPGDLNGNGTDHRGGGGDISGGDIAVAVAEPAVAVQTLTSPVDAQPETATIEIVDTAETDTEPDDLKVISGIGPKLEALLHEIGIVTYEMIAAFPADYIAQLDDYLAFDGRIERDGWVEQAAELAQTRPAKSAVLPDLPEERPENATSLD
ncbi:MAG: heterodisulfide reductase-related iron-sulfur binding cluster, partial [Actinomycetota bacterium]